jgi:hypothetical protein
MTPEEQVKSESLKAALHRYIDEQRRMRGEVDGLDWQDPKCRPGETG